MGNTPQMEETGVEAKKLTARELSMTIGATGTEMFNGMLGEEENGDLTGIKGAETYDAMRRKSAPIWTLLRVIKLPILSTKWRVEPQGDTPQAKEIAEFVQNCLFEWIDKGWMPLLGEILTELEFGFSLFEKVYRTNDEGQIVLKDLAFRQQKTIYAWEMEGGEPGVQQQLISPAPHGENKGKMMISIPQAKLLRFTFMQEGMNYEGISLLRPIYMNYYILDKLYRFDATRHERTSQPIPTFYVPGTATDEQYQKAEAIVKNIRSHAQLGLSVPGSKNDGRLFEYTVPNVQGASDIKESINMHKEDIFLTGLSQFLLLGMQEKGGSRALSEDQSDLFILSLTFLAQQICDVINYYLIPELVDFNFDIGDEKYPVLTFDKIGGIEYGAYSTMLQSLVSSKVLTPDSDLEDHVREQVGLPKKMEVEETPLATDPKTPVTVEDETDEDEEEEIDDADADKMEEDKEKKMNEGGCTHGEYMYYSKLFNNETILKLQAKVGNEYSEELKKKGIRFNEREDKAWRPLTFAEKKVNRSMLIGNFEKYEAMLEERLTEYATKTREKILTSLKKAIDNNDLEALSAIASKYKGEAVSVITEVQKEMFEIGKKSAASELVVKIPPTSPDIKGAMKIQNEAIVDKFTNDIDNKMKGVATQMISKQGSLQTLSGASVVGEAGEVFDKVMDNFKSEMKTLSVNGALNLGRTTIYERYPERVYGFQFSAILDGKTTRTCLSLDGRVVKAGSAEYYQYSPPRHWNCRSIWVGILMEEIVKPEFTGIPSSIPAGMSIDNARDMEAPVLLPNSPALKILRDEIKQRQDKIEQYEKLGKYENRIDEHKKAIKKLEKSIQMSFVNGVAKTVK